MTLSRGFSCATAILILLGSGILYEDLALDSQDLETAIARLEQVPMEVGDWKAVSVPQDATDAKSFEQTGAKGYWVRNYVNQRTKASALVILMGGRVGKMAVHTPDICYRGAGYELNDSPVVCTIKDSSAMDSSQFWTTQFTKKNGTTTRLRLYWAWSTDGTWEAPAYPRWQFQGKPYLFKLYVSRELNHGPTVTPPQDSGAHLLQVLIPPLNETLFFSKQPT